MVDNFAAVGYVAGGLVAVAGTVIAQDWVTLEEFARWGTGSILVATAAVIVSWVMRASDHVKAMWTDALEAAQAAADAADKRAEAAEARAEAERQRRIATENQHRETST